MELPAAEGGAATQEQHRTFEEFFRERYDPLFRTMCLLARDRHEAEDLTQEAFSKLWERWDRVGALDGLEAYLHRMAFNAFLSRKRRASMALRRVVAPKVGHDETAQVDRAAVVLQALRTLTPRQRAAVVLLDALDCSSDEAAQILGISASTVRVLAGRARATLRERIVDDDD